MEIMVKSISEAGFPANPLESDWSDIVRVEFPEGELATDSIIELVGENNIDSVKVQLRNELVAEGIYQHVEDAFEAGDKYYAHTATTIASGFLTSEQTPISLFDKLNELQNEILRLRAQVEGTLGELLVNIIDEDGNVTKVTNNETVKLFAGYYINELPETNYKGHIVTKNFKIQLSNTKASNLELVARIIGDVTKAAPTSTTSTTFGLGTGSIDSTVTSNTYYTTEGKYDLVPVLYQNVEAADLTENMFNLSPAQSSQLKGQYIYSRYQNLANDMSLYVNSDIDSTKNTGYDVHEYGLSYTFNGVTTSNTIKDYSNATSSPYQANGVAQTDFIWSGAGVTDLTTFATIGSTNYDNGLFLHTDHPLLDPSYGLSLLQIQSNGYVGMPKTAVRRADDTYGKQQTAFRMSNTVNSDGVVGLRPTVKTSFDPMDQYTLGGHSCGSFLFLAPIDKESLVVDANNKRGKKIIQGGEANTVTVDLIFQYRMTDYYGVGSEGTGKVGGVSSNPANLTYAKKAGFDILDSNNNDFQFDIEVYAKYKPTGKSTNSITSSMLSNYVGGGGSSSGFNGSELIDFSAPTINQQ